MKVIQKMSIYLLLVLSQSAFTASAQESKDSKDSLKTTTKDWVEQRNFVFVAERAVPMGKPSRQLTSEYTLTVSGDTIDCYLPYYGRSYSAPINSEGGIKFKTTDAGFTISPKKKDGWDVLIKPKEVPDVQELRLSVYSSGSATLQVSSTNRQMITFNGYVRQPQSRKKK